MSSKYKFIDPDGIYFISFAVIHWMDVFTRRLYKDTFLESLEFCRQKKGLNIHAYVLMTNHAHLIISKRDTYLLEEIVRDFKKYTALKLIHMIENNAEESRKEWMMRSFRKAGSENSNNKIFQFWQQDNHPILLEGIEMAIQKFNYLHNNPVESGIVFRAEDYLYSSAADYAGGKGLIKIDLLI